jgi:Zn-finger nucleic acid-binding protein
MAASWRTPRRPADGTLGAVEGHGDSLRCPNDSARLVEVERSGFLIDACPQCRGVWLDRGELDKILVAERRMTAADPDEDFFSEVEGRRTKEPPRQRPYEEPPRRRRRGFLEDLLDFD